MTWLQAGLVSATVLCSLVAGLVLTFASVVMPGIGNLNDRGFLQAFQAVDRIIQNNQPVFMVVWVGSVLTLVTSGLLGLRQLEGTDRLLLVAAVVIYLVGVQLPTGSVNVPLNNQLQTLEVTAMDDSTLAEARKRFEPRWNRWNVFRTVAAVLTSTLLVVLVLRL